MGQRKDRFRPEQASRAGRRTSSARWRCLRCCKGRSGRGDRRGDCRRRRKGRSGRRRGRCSRRGSQATPRGKAAAGGSTAGGSTARGERGWLPTRVWSLHGRKRVHSEVVAAHRRRVSTRALRVSVALSRAVVVQQARTRCLYLSWALLGGTEAPTLFRFEYDLRLWSKVEETVAKPLVARLRPVEVFVRFQGGAYRRSRSSASER